MSKASKWKVQLKCKDDIVWLFCDILILLSVLESLTEVTTVVDSYAEEKKEKTNFSLKEITFEIMN